MNKTQIKADGKRQIANRYLDLVDRDLARDKIKSAKEWYSLAESMDTDNPGLKIRRDRIAAAVSPTPQPPRKPNDDGQSDTAQPKYAWKSKETTGYVIPGPIYVNTSGQQCRNIEQIAYKNGERITGKATACKTERGWVDVSK